MPIDLENDTTLSDATAKLEAAEAAEGPLPREAFVQTDEEGAAQSGAAAGQEGKAKTKTDTPAGAGGPESKVENPTPKTAADSDKSSDKTDDPNKSGFAKSQERLEKTWKSVNERKGQLEQREQQLRAREEAIAKSEQQFQARQAKAQARHTPEEYEQAGQRNTQAAKQFDLQARGLEAEAEELKLDGKYTEAESALARAKDLREQAAYARGVAKQLVEHAAHVRTHPDPTAAQLAAQHEQQLREYTLKAAQEFPELAQEGSAFQRATIANIQAARSAGLDENEFPVVRYWSARMAHADTESARVPGLVEKLAKAEARVKELEALTTPGGGEPAVQHAARGKSASDEEEGQALRAEAERMS